MITFHPHLVNYILTSKDKNLIHLTTNAKKSLSICSHHHSAFVSLSEVVTSSFQQYSYEKHENKKESTFWLVKAGRWWPQLYFHFPVSIVGLVSEWELLFPLYEIYIFVSLCFIPESQTLFKAARSLLSTDCFPHIKASSMCNLQPLDHQKVVFSGEIAVKSNSDSDVQKQCFPIEREWSKSYFIFHSHQVWKNVSNSSVQKCDGKHSHFTGFGPIQKWKIPPFFPLCFVLWPGSCTHATFCFTCSPPVEQ